MQSNHDGIWPRLYAPLRDSQVRSWILTLAGGSVAIAEAATLDSAWALKSGVGLAQHFGFLTIFLTAPCLVLVANSLLEDLVAVLHAPDEFTAGDVHVDRAVQESREAFGGKVDWLTMALLSAGGIFLLERNITVTRTATKYFSRDVFDSAAHPLSYYAAKVYLAIVWVLLYPLVVTLGMRAIRTLYRLVREGARRRRIKVEFFGVDDCAGVTRVGRLFYEVFFISLLFSACSFASFMTHQTYRPQITLLALGSCAVGLVMYFAALRPLHRYVAAERRVPLNRIATELSAAYDAHDWPACANLLSARSALLSINTYALPTSEAAFVNLIPFVQLIIAVWVVVAAPPGA